MLPTKVWDIQPRECNRLKEHKNKLKVWQFLGIKFVTIQFYGGLNNGKKSVEMECNKQVYMKQYPNCILKNTMVFSTLANSKKGE